MPTAAATTGHKRSQMEQDFDKLRLVDQPAMDDTMGPRGLQSLCTELGIVFNELEMFVLVWKLGATQSYCIAKSEWLHSAYAHKIDHIGQLRTMLATWKTAVKDDPNQFAEMYSQIYDFIRGDDEKLLPLDKAVRAWHVLLPENERFPFLPLWVQWATQQYKRPVSRDVWRELLQFSMRIKDLTQYDSNDKWPSAMDDFVEWALEHTGVKKPAVADAAMVSTPAATA